MSDFNLNNLMLDDNTFEVLPDGDYHFMVESHEIGYADSDKLPPNTQQIICYLQIPFKDAETGEVKTAKIRHRMNVYKKALFAIRQFAECIGMCSEKGRFAFNVDKIDGLTGVCAITSGVSAKGNEYNNVQAFYSPSKAPAVTANDDAWNKQEVEITDADWPFGN